MQERKNVRVYKWTKKRKRQHNEIYEWKKKEWKNENNKGMNE